MFLTSTLLMSAASSALPQETPAGAFPIATILARGQAAFSDGDFGRAERYFATANALSPGEPAAQYWRARAIEAMRGSAAAVSSYDFAQGLDPQNVEIAWRRARAHLLRYGRIGDALDKLERMSEGGERSLFLGRFGLLVADRTTDEDTRQTWLQQAADELAAARDALGDDIELLLAEAALAQARGDAAAALAKLRPLVALAPEGISEDGVPHATALGYALLGSAEVDERAWQPEEVLDEAVASLSRGLAVAPDGEAAQTLGRLLHRRGEARIERADVMAAVDAFLLAADLARDAPSQALALSWLGNSYRRLGQHENAAAAFARALDAEPTNAPAAFGLARIALVLGRPEGAATAFLWAEAFSDGDWPGWVPWAHLVAGDVARALAAVEERVAAGRSVEALRGIEGLARLVGGDPAAALAAFEQAELDAWGGVGQVWALVSLGRAEEARQRGWRYEHLGVCAERVEPGLAIELVLPGTPAEAAGLMPGDVIAAAGDFSLSGWGEAGSFYTAFQAATEAVSTVTLTILRDREPMKVDVTIGEVFER